ncbi:hypothetical protein EON67_00915 [archaeon]|nr:MAG: hypothetical protein EON67_00915 [archaeon]
MRAVTLESNDVRTRCDKHALRHAPITLTRSKLLATRNGAMQNTWRAGLWLHISRRKFVSEDE